MEEQENVQKENSVSDFQQSEKKKVGIIVGIVIAVIAVFGIIYFLVFNNSKNIFLRAINREYQRLDNQISDLSNNDIYQKSKNKTVSTNYKLDFDIHVQDELLSESGYADMIHEINQLNVEMNGAIDRKNKTFAYDMSINRDKNNLIGLGIYAKEKSIYLELKELFNKYIEFPIEEYDDMFESDTSIDDSRYILKTIKNVFLNNLDKKDFVQTKEKIELNGKSISTKKITYSFNEKKALEVTKRALEDLKGNSKFIKKIAKITGTKESEVKKELNDSLENIKKSLKDTKDDQETIEISVYTTGLFHNGIKYEIIVKEDSDKTVLTYSNYKDIIEINALENSDKVFTAKITKESKDHYKTVATMDTLQFEMTTTNSKEKNTHDYKMTESESNMVISGTIASENKTVKRNKEYSGNIKVTCNMSIQDQKDVIKLAVNGKSNTKIGEKIELPTIDKSVKYKEISQNDYYEIMNNISKNEALMNFINSLFGSIY